MSRDMYRAVHLSVPNVIAQFKTVYRDSDGMMIDSRTYNVDLNTGTTIDWDVSLQVSIIVFLAPTRSPRSHFVCVSVCSAQSALEHLIFIFLAQILHDDFMMTSG